MNILCLPYSGKPNCVVFSFKEFNTNYLRHARPFHRTTSSWEKVKTQFQGTTNDKDDDDDKDGASPFDCPVPEKTFAI